MTKEWGKEPERAENLTETGKGKKNKKKKKLEENGREIMMEMKHKFGQIRIWTSPIGHFHPTARQEHFIKFEFGDVTTFELSPGEYLKSFTVNRRAFDRIYRQFWYKNETASRPAPYSSNNNWVFQLIKLQLILLLQLVYKNSYKETFLKSR